MYVDERFDLKIIAFFAWRNLLQATIVSTAVYCGYEWLGWRFLSVPFVSVATIGTAVALYVGFKNNSSYERLWEAQRIWGAIVNVSRAFAAGVLGIAGGNTALACELVKSPGRTRSGCNCDASRSGTARATAKVGYRSNI